MGGCCDRRGASVVDVHALHGDQGPWRLSIEHRGHRLDYVLRVPTPRIDAAMVRTGAAALKVAEQHGLPAPRLIDADLQGSVTGVPATLETVAGTTAWRDPSRSTTSPPIAVRAGCRPHRGSRRLTT